MEEGKLNSGIEELIERCPFQLNYNSFGKRGISSSPGALREGGRASILLLPGLLKP